MKTELRHYTVKSISEGFVCDELEGKGLYGLNGKLTIQPEYQRNYIYADGERDLGYSSLLRARHVIGSDVRLYKSPRNDCLRLDFVGCFAHA